jgi:hypothetical protein
LEPHVGGLLVRAEETAARHIGRRPENDQLFVGNGKVEAQPMQLEPWSPQGAMQANAQPLTEKRLENRAVLQQVIYEMTEPKYTAFLDKLPRQPRRWGKADKATEWAEQNGSFGYRFTIIPNADRSFGYSTVSCVSITPESSAGVRARLSMQDNRPSTLSAGWDYHMDYKGDETILMTLAPGLMDFTDKSCTNPYSTSVFLDLNAMTATVTHETIASQAESVAYSFDDQQNTFVPNSPNMPILSVEQFADITQKVLNLLPTIEVTNR